MAGEVPVSGVIGYCLVQPLHTLKDELHRDIYSRWAQQLRHLCRDLLCGKGFIEPPYRVVIHAALQRLLVDALHKRAHSPLLYECHTGLKGNKVCEVAHIYAVEIGITDLRRRAYNYNLLWLQSCQNSYYALAQSGPPYYAVVYYHKVVSVRFHYAGGYVIDVRREVSSGGALCYKGAQFDIF